MVKSFDLYKMAPDISYLTIIGAVVNVRGLVSKEVNMERVRKGKCRSCGKTKRLELKGSAWVVVYHDLSKPGPNPECPGTGKLPKD